MISFLKHPVRICMSILITAFLTIFFSANVNAQQNGVTFSPLGSTQYQEKINQLEKYIVPKKYTEKSAQAWYQEMMTDRNKALIHLFKDDAIIYDTLLLSKCNNIANRIIAANNKYHFDSIRFYINRSSIPNAACYGEGTIMVNLGLFLWIDNDDELAIVLAHEMSHQVLDHSQNQVEKNIATLTSEGFKEELNDIKKSKEGRYERFRKLMKSFSTETGKHSTYKESEADSLAAVLIERAGFNKTAGSVILLKLDNADDIFTSPDLYSLKDFFQKIPVDQSFFVVKRKYNGLSSVTVTMNADKDFDSIKTHPDCIKRYEVIAGQDPKPTVNCCTSLGSMYSTYKQDALLEIVRNLYENNAIGLCAHFCIFALRNNYNAAIYNEFLSLCFSQLYWSDKRLQRFNAVNAHASSQTTLKSLQDYLFDASIDDLDKLSAYFLTTASSGNPEDQDFALLMRNTQVASKDTVNAIAAFNKKYPTSKYQYLIKIKSQ
ncbi:MAG: M48 family metallopeptidase [Ferruginibacter sp.]